MPWNGGTRADIAIRADRGKRVTCGSFLLTRATQCSRLRNMSNNQKLEMERFAEMFKALSNPHRLHIFLKLISCCPPGTRCAWDAEAKRYVGQLAQEVSVAPSTVSHHIKELRNASLINVARQGKNIECWVDPDAVRSLQDLLAGRFPDGLLGDGLPQEIPDANVDSRPPDQGDAPCCHPTRDPIEPIEALSAVATCSGLCAAERGNLETSEEEGESQ